jgi:hypothetical protein
MSPPGRNANGRSLRGRKQIQSSPQSGIDALSTQLRLLECKLDVLLQWVCHLVDRTYETERLLKFPLHSENKNPNQKN